MEVVVKTDLGKVNDVNEDAVGSTSAMLDSINGPIKVDILFVADGVGGRNKGEIASNLVAKNILLMLKTIVGIEGDMVKSLQKMMPKWFEEMDKRIKSESIKNPEWAGMCTTLVMAVVVDDTMVICWAGDSRLYMYRDGKLRQVTKDHSFAQELIDKGEATPEEAARHPKRHMIHTTVGGNSRGFDVKAVKWTRGTVLMCTDGLTDMVPDPDIERILGDNGSLEAQCDRLINTALENGGMDNVSVLLARR